MTEMIYKPAKRGNVACVIMIAGPAGVGKTYSALRLAKGLAGPGGKICLADTDNGRAALYADDFEFFHKVMEPPFRPQAFMDALAAAQKEKATVVIFDNFTAEHTGPGGVLDYHEDELNRVTGGDLSKREAMNMVAWIKPKVEHKTLLRQRMYRQNVHIILCCEADRKVAMVKQTEGPKRGKVVPVDQGYQAVCGSDVPYAMTVALMLTDPKRPGVPVPIKALLPALQPIISLDRPIDETTGERIAAWARGDKAPEKARQAEPNRTEAPPPVDQGGGATRKESLPTDKPPKEDKSPAIAASLVAEYQATQSLEAHFALVDNPTKRSQVDWLKRNRKELFTKVNTAVADSYNRHQPTTKPPPPDDGMFPGDEPNEPKQGALV